jgi:hypothetical protein
LIIDVRMNSFTAGSEVLYWSLSTPMAHSFEPFASLDALAA